MRTVRNHLWRVLSLAALVGAVLLLMADSAEDCQAPAAYQAHYAVTTNCGGQDYTATITVKNVGTNIASVEVTSGDLPDTTAWLQYPCIASGQPAPEVTQLELVIANQSCLIELATQLGTAITCDGGCTIQLDPLP
jgi:hypothetical protein